MKKLSAWAKEQGISYNTAFRWFQLGTLPVKAVQHPTGSIFITEEEQKEENRMIVLMENILEELKIIKEKMN